ncbi:MAG TPA: protoglobin domain-containing protein, partial [Roseiarcus sp.]|nr:protoglobin domain-containing protein [Roseiarcus sp.]
MTEPGRGQDNLSERLDFMGLDGEARAALKTLQPLIGRAIGPALAAFYEKTRAHPSADKALGDERLPTVKRLQERHWATIAAAEFGEGYSRSVREIGEANGRMGLEPRWVIGGYALIVERLVAAIVKEQWPTLLRMRRAGPDDVA